MALYRPSPTPEVRAALMETFADPLRAQVYISIYERPGATIAQLARRIDQPARRIRHQIERLIAAGLLVIEAETPRRNARERHYRAVEVPTIDERGDPWTEEARGKMALSILKCIAADIGRAFRNRTFGTRRGHTEVRIPGEVDERGWAEIGTIVIETMERVEGTMIAGAERLEAAEEPGIEVISALLFFEAPAWPRSEQFPQGPRRSQWTEDTRDSPAGSGRGPRAIRDVSCLSAELRDVLIDTLSNRFRAQVFIVVAEKPGVTIAEAAIRLGEPPRRVRHQIERLVDAGLVEVDTETRRRNARERHYRVICLPNIVEEVGSRWTDEERRRIAHSVVSVIMVDLDRAVGEGSFGNRPGFAVVRIPGEVDEVGWEEIAELMVRTMVAIEAAMLQSAVRLEDAGGAGIEVLSALLLFEGLPWEPVNGDRQGPRPSHWRLAPRGLADT